MEKQKFSMTRSNFGARGWFLVVYCFVAMMVYTMCTDSISNLALPQLCETLGWNYTTMLSLTSVYNWAVIIFFLIFGALLKKLSAFKCSLAAGVVFSICAMIFPTMKQAWAFAIMMLLIIIIGNCWYNQFNNILQSNWFPRKKGLVVGWSTMGIPIGAGLGTKIYFMLFPKLGMHGVYILYGCIALVFVIISAFVLAEYPENVGCFPDNDKSFSREEAEKQLLEGLKKSENSMWTNARLLRTKEVWQIGISLGIQMLFSGAFIAVIVPRFMAFGYDQGTAVNFMMITALLGAVGSYIMGFVDAKTNPKTAALCVHIFGIAACLLSCVNIKAVIIVSLILVGIVIGGSVNVLMSITSTMWGRYGFPRALTIILVINQLVGSAGAVVVAQLQDRLGWTPAYLVVAAIAVVGCLLLIPIKLDSIRKIEEAEGVAAEDR